MRTVSSRALAEQFHLNAAQIRKDLAYFGEFGVRGVGYYVKELRRHLRQILGIDKACGWRSWGPATSGWRSPTIRGFATRGSRLRRSSTPRGTRSGSARAAACAIHDIREFRAVVRREQITIAVIAVPAESAQAVVNAVVAAGIKAVLNFSPGALQVPPDVKLKSVDLTVSLESLSFFLAQGEGCPDACRASPPGSALSHVDPRGRSGWSTSPTSR